MSLLRWIFRRRREQDLEEEIQSHLEMATRDRIEFGESSDEARHSVQREFGNAMLVKEVTREMWGWGWAERLLQDVRYTLRQLRKNPSFAALAIITLALGIGVNTAMFTVIDSVLIRPLPFPNADRLVDIEAIIRGFFQSISWSDYRTIQSGCRSLGDVAGYDQDETVIQVNGGAQNVTQLTITANLFDLLGIRPTLGRPFSAADAVAGAPLVGILSDQLWREDFGADPHVLGRQVRVANGSVTVVGVMPVGLRFPVGGPYGEAKRDLVLWLPMRPSPGAVDGREQATALIGKLRAHASLSEAQAELTVVTKRISGPGREDLRFNLRPYREVVTEAERPALLALAGASILVLLIASFNVANLQIARHLPRRQELAVRAALGAGRSRLLRQLMAEGAVLALAGTVAGFGFASAVLAAVHRLPPDFIPRADEIQVRLPVFAMLAIFAAVTTILSSVAPAVLATGSPVEEVLREGSGGATAGKKRARLSKWMVAGEVALSAILLVSAGLLFHTLYNLEHIRFGFDLDQVTTFTATPSSAMGVMQALVAQKPGGNPPRESIVTRVYQPIRDRLRQLPGVVDVGFSAWAPFDHNTMWVNYRSPKHPEVGPRGVMSQICLVSSGYASAMGTPILEGRMVADSDTATNTWVAVVNQTFARLAFRGENPVGQQIIDGSPAHNVYKIVGVLGDARQHDLTHTPDPEVLLAYQQFPTTGFMYTVLVASGTNYIIRTRGEAHLAGAIRQIFRQSAPDIALDHFRTMRAALDEVTFNQRLGLYLTGSFAGVAILMVLTGLYGVLSQLVGQRRREIGVRMALGATNRSILQMVLRQGSILALAGLLLGLLASLAAGRLLRSFLYGVKPLDAATYIAAAAALLALSITAALLPARRASRIDPMAALRSE
jgi:putative ABC transport system permease protein